MHLVGFIVRRIVITYEYRVKQSLYRPGQAQRVEAPRFEDNQQTREVRLSTLCTGRFITQEILLVLISVRG